MKIAMFHNLPPGGAKRVAFEHAQGLSERGHSVHAYVLQTATETYLPLNSVCSSVHLVDAPSSAQQSAVSSGESRSRKALPGRGAAYRALSQIGTARRWFELMNDLEQTYCQLAHEIDNAGFDVVYVHHCRFLLSPYLLKCLKTPSVYFAQDTLRHVHEWDCNYDPGYDGSRNIPGQVKTMGRRVSATGMLVRLNEDYRNARNLRAATVVAANSLYSGEAITRTCGVTARICNLGVDTHRFGPSSHKEERANSVLSVGTLEPHKRHDFILKAIARIPERYRPELRIIGYDPNRFGRSELSPYAAGLLEMANQLGVKVHLEKEVTDDVLEKAYRNAGVVAFAPYLEPFGFVALEAMACGAAVVGVNEAGLRETVIHEVTGLLTERSEEDFSAALMRVLSNNTLARQFGENGREHVISNWTWEKSTNRIESLFEIAISQMSQPSKMLVMQ